MSWSCQPCNPFYMMTVAPSSGSRWQVLPLQPSSSLTGTTCTYGAHCSSVGAAVPRWRTQQPEHNFPQPCGHWHRSEFSRSSQPLLMNQSRVILQHSNVPSNTLLTAFCLLWLFFYTNYIGKLLEGHTALYPRRQYLCGHHHKSSLS
jgi:hypothetical protein